MSSSSGEEIAASAASLARLSPVAEPVPIIAIPISDITVRTSAKSTLIRPGQVISSAIPCTAPRNTSFAFSNTSSNEVSLPSTGINLSFGMVINESTTPDISLIPISACDIRLVRSKANGLVTTATVRMPISLAIWAITGAAPVPVPPPMPAVTKSMLEPSIASWMRSRSSRAACLPIPGSAPAPSPLVILEPICMVVRISIFLSACTSVLTQMYSTPSIPAETMC